MKKIQVTKEYTLIDVEDLEKAVSEKAGRPVKISEMDLSLDDCFPYDTMTPAGMVFLITIDDANGNKEYYGVKDLFFDRKKDIYVINGELCSESFLQETFLDTDLLFNFDISLFRSFERSVDTYD